MTKNKNDISYFAMDLSGFDVKSKVKLLINLIAETEISCGYSVGFAFTVAQLYAVNLKSELLAISSSADSSDVLY